MSVKHFRSIVVLGAVLALGAAKAQASELAADPFLIGANPASGEYTAGDLVPQDPTVSSFDTPWADGLATTIAGTFDTVSTGLSWDANYTDSGGSVQYQHATTLANTQAAVRGFDNAAGYSGGVYYMSGLMSFDENFNTSSTASALTGLLNAEEGDASVQYVIGSQWGFQGNDAGGVDAVFRARHTNDGTGNYVYNDVIASNLAPGTHLFVIRVEPDLGGGSNDMVSIWLDPDSVANEFAAGTPDVEMEYANWLSPSSAERIVDTLVLNATDVGDGAVVGYDEVRLGEDWADVVYETEIGSPWYFREGNGEYEHLASELRERLDSGNRKLGTNTEMLLGSVAASQGAARDVLAFSLEDLPAGATITDVELTLTLNRSDIKGTGVEQIELRQPNPSEPMVEEEVTWNDIRAGVPWTEGGGDPLTTVLSTTDGFATNEDVIQGDKVTFSATTEFLAVVQNAVNGDDLLELLIMSPGTEAKVDTEDRNFIGFYTDDFSNPSYRPTLMIAFEEGGSLDGDLNSDGFVGGDDLDIVRSFWGQNVTAGDLLQGDPSGDGFVGGDDLDIVRANWGQGTPPAPAAVPEPSTWFLLAAAGLWGLVARRRRETP